MKSVANDPARALTRLQKLLDEQPGEDKLSGTLYAEKAADGSVHLYRVKAEADGKLNRALHRFNAHSADARELVRAKIISVLQDNGLEITEDIRKALPSKFKLGNTAELGDAIAMAKYKFTMAQIRAAGQKYLPAGGANAVAAKLKNEIESMDWSSTASFGTLFRSNSDGTKALTAYLAGEFGEVTELCVADAIRAGTASLRDTGSLDQAMVAAHQALLSSFKHIQFSSKFKEVVSELLTMVDTVAQQKIADKARVPTKPGEPLGAVIPAKTINQVAETAKQLVLTSVLLRSLSPELTDSLALGEISWRREAETITGSKPPSEFSLKRVQNYVLALFNKSDKNITLGGIGKVDAQAALPEYMKFLRDPDRNNLGEFTAMKSLEQEILTNVGGS